MTSATIGRPSARVGARRAGHAVAGGFTAMLLFLSGAEPSAWTTEVRRLRIVVIAGTALAVVAGDVATRRRRPGAVASC